MNLVGMTLEEILSTYKYHLAIAPGFFRFFAYCGFLVELEERGLIPNIVSVSGASAGALV